MNRLSKQTIFSLSLCFLFCGAPFWGAAQTSSGDENSPIPVAFMVFVGDDLSIGAEFQGDTISEVRNLGRFVIQPVSAEELPQSLTFPPDQPPDSVYLGNSRLVLTGEYYIDTDDLQHFQLWLWNSANGSLVYTDEMVFEDTEEAQGYLPPMVNWIFSHVPVEQRITVMEMTPQAGAAAASGEGGEAAVETRNRSRFYIGEFYLGLRGGGAFTAYSSLASLGYAAGMSQGFSGNAAVVAEYRMFRFLGLQAEAIFNYDAFKVAKITEDPGRSIRSTDKYRTMSLMVPLLIKVPLAIGKFVLSPFGGVYYTMPLGPLQMEPDDSSVGQAGSFSYRINPPIGLILGLDTSLPLGPGELFVDLRFSRDVGMTIAASGYGIQYIRNQVGLSLGYKFLLFQPSSAP